jgi:mono/diheme cytochrome c family protein
MRRRKFVLAAAGAVLIAGIAAGCNSEGTTSATPQTVIGTLPKQTTPTTPTAKGDPVAGKQVFLTAGCTGCHTLKAANAHGTVGPTHGKGVMPSFSGSLSTKQIADVAAFVYQSTH